MNNNLANLIFGATVPNWVANSFPIIRLIMMIIIVLLCVAIVVVVLIQPSNSSGMGAISGQSETYYSRNKSHTLEGLMKKLTVIFSIVILVLGVLFLVSLIIYNPELDQAAEIFSSITF